MKKNRIVTIPNLLTLLRLILIPQLMWLYLEKQDYVRTVILLAVSGATDILDGAIARKFDLVSDFGKAFDPIVDKMTQAAMLCCLGASFRELRILLFLLIVKECVSGVMSLVSIKKTGQVHGAEWHGKVVTVLIYVLIADRMIPNLLSGVLFVLCIAMMILSMAMYTKRSWMSIQKQK